MAGAMTMTTYPKGRHQYGRLLGVGLAVLVAGGVLAESAHADYWGASAATAVPEFLPDGSVRSYTFTDRLGIGVSSTAIPRGSDCVGMVVVNCVAIARLFVPVTAPLGTRFETIWLRAIDTSPTGYVQASLYQQRVGFRDRKLLGWVRTRNAGFQVLTGPVETGSLDRDGNPVPVEVGPGLTHYIEVAIARGLELQISGPQGGSENLVAYDVGLDFELGPCDSGHPDYDPQRCPL
jgi:hypothetical protein